ncbi:MAG: FtsX-like permease family protein, partial [Bacteroidota bacterium]
QQFYALNEWAGNNLYHTYIRLRPNAKPETLAAKFPALVEAKAGDRLRTLGFEKSHFLEAVQDIYLTSDADFSIGPMGDLSFVYIFAAIAIFILLIACINFMNLSTAKATIRAQEIGVRKVIGASRSMLSGQFLAEAFVYTSIAFLLAYLMSELAMPVFNELAGKELSLNIREDNTLFLWMLGILLFTAFLAGSYPAIYLSSFSPANIFRGSFGDRFSARQVRKGLVIVQFIVSIALIQSVLVIQEQMNYVRQKKLGFNTEAKLVVPLNTPEAAQNFSLYKEQLLNLPEVFQVGGTNAVPGTSSVEDMLVYGEGQSREMSYHSMRNWVDSDYLPLMQFDLLAGRFFEKARLADTLNSVVINEKLMKDLGYTLEEAVGKKLFWNWDGELNTHQIIGVIGNFHTATLHEEVHN